HPLYTHNYSFGKYGLLLIIQAAILTILILKLYTKIRNVPYQNEFDLGSASLKGKINTTISFFSNKKTQYILLYGLVLVGAYISIMFAITFTQMMIVLFPSVIRPLVRFALPIIGVSFGVY